MRSSASFHALPPVLAGPLAEWVREDDPRLALWHACDVVEMTLRLAVALGLGDWARAGVVPVALRAEVARRLEAPTLGKWRGMALALAAAPAPGTGLGDLWGWISKTLEPLLVAGDPSTSLTELRNRLAHGGGIAHGLAAELDATWTPRLDAAFAPLVGLGDVRLVAPGARTVLGDPDDAALARATAWAEGRSLPADAVVAVRGEHVLPLWPLVAFASPSGEPRAVPQVYVRRGEVRLVMTPLGAERAAVAESSEAAVTALLGAGLFEPPPAPVVTYEIAGFEADLRRDAGQCVGRDAEVARVTASLRGVPGLFALWGPPGSGKSLVVARAVSGAPDVLYFRFKAGDGRATRDGFLRYVVERAGTPPKGKPLFAAAKELLAAGAFTLVVDGLDDIDAEFARDVLAPLGKVSRVIAIARAPVTGAGAVIDGGLPPMSPDDVRTMLLDKIGPLSKKLVALDRDRGEAVVNPFVDAVVERAAGLPVYVAYVIGDLLGGKLRTLDTAQLPPSLAAYHAAALRRGGAGAAQQLITPLVATLALAKEPLAGADLHALLVHRVLATDDAEGATAVADALAQIATLLRRHEDRYGLFHATLRDHVLTSPEQHMAIATARVALARAARELSLPYLDDHGVAHQVEGGDLDGAVAALGWPRIVARVARGGLPGVLADLALVAARRDDVRDLAGFVRGAAHHVERGGVTALVQAALADGDDSPISAAVRETNVIRRLDRPARAIRGARQRTMLGHAAPVRALAWVDGAIVSASADGTLRVWDGDDGSFLRTIAPDLATLSATTRAASAGAPTDLAGTMPILGVHAICAHGDHLIAAHGDGVIRAWSLEGGEALAELRIRAYAWGLCTLQDRVAVACDDGVLRLLDAETLAPIAETTPPAASAGAAPYLYTCAAGAVVLVVAGASRGLGVLDPVSLAPLGELRGHEGAPRGLAAVPGTSWMLSTARDGTLALWDLAARKLLAKVEVPGGAWSVAAGPARRGVAARAEPERLEAGATPAPGHDYEGIVGTRAGTLVRLRLPDLALVRSAPVHAGPVAAVLVLPDGRVVTGGEDRAVRLVDLEAAAAARPSHAGAITAIATAGPAIVTAGADGALKMWDLRGRSLRTIPIGNLTAVAAAVLPDGVVAFSAAGAQLAEHRLTPSGTVASSALPPAPATILALTARSGDELVAACSDGAVRVWTRAGGWQAPIARHDAAALAVALWGTKIVSGGADAMLRLDGAPRKAHTWDVVAVAAGGDTVASLGKEGALIVWDVACDRPRETVPAHGRALAVAPGGGLVAAATRDDCVVVRTPDGTERARWTCDASPQVLAFADARTLVIGDTAGEIAVLALP